MTSASGALRLLVLSDLHLEKRPLAAVRAPADGFDLLVCAGDVWEGEPERAIEALTILARGRPALLVPGNHDRYRSGPDDPRTDEAMLAALRRAAEGSPVTLLEAGERATIDGVTVIGATLWTDWTLAGLWRPDIPADEAHDAARAAVLEGPTASREYRGAILRAGGRAWHPDDALAAHRRDREALVHALSASRAGPVICVTHHAPLVDILAPYRAAPGIPWWIPAFYASTLLADFEDAMRPDLWISGHFHAAHDLRVGRTRCVANPVAAADYRPGFIVEIG